MRTERIMPFPAFTVGALASKCWSPLWLVALHMILPFSLKFSLALKEPIMKEVFLTVRTYLVLIGGEHTLMRAREGYLPWFSSSHSKSRSESSMHCESHNGWIQYHEENRCKGQNIRKREKGSYRLRS